MGSESQRSQSRVARSSGSDGKESTCNVGDPGSIPGLGISPGEGNDYPFRYSCLENPTDRGAWQTTRGCRELCTAEQLTGEGNGTPLQYSCLENPMDGGAWWAAVHAVAKSRTRLK